MTTKAKTTIGIKITRNFQTPPILYSLLWLDQQDEDQDMVHNSYYADGELEGDLGYDIIRAKQTLPCGTYHVKIKDVNGDMLDAVFTSWMSRNAPYEPIFIGLAYYAGDEDSLKKLQKHYGKSFI